MTTQKALLLRRIPLLFRGCLFYCQRQYHRMNTKPHTWYMSSVLSKHQCFLDVYDCRKSFCIKYSASADSNTKPTDVSSSASSNTKMSLESEHSHNSDKVLTPIQAAKMEEEKRATEILENLSPEKAKRLKVLKLEYDIWLSSGRRMPSKMTNTMWLRILESETVGSRVKSYKFWHLKEILKQKEELKKAMRREKHLAALSERSKLDDDTYPNKILRKITDGAYHEYNFAFSMIHGPHLVFDLSYEDMREQDFTNLVHQFLKCHGYNKNQSEPFHFHFCNVKKGSLMANTLEKYFVNLDKILYTVSEESYLNFYPHKNLVYLSPYAKQSMTNFNYDDVYILGGMVDKVSEIATSTAKAKKDKLRCVKLPIDKYLQWVKGSKALTLDQMVMILHTLKKTNNWREAFKHVPKRKFLWPEEITEKK